MVDQFLNLLLIIQILLSLINWRELWSANGTIIWSFEPMWKIFISFSFPKAKNEKLKLAANFKKKQLSHVATLSLTLRQIRQLMCDKVCKFSSVSIWLVRFLAYSSNRAIRFCSSWMFCSTRTLLGAITFYKNRNWDNLPYLL